MAVHKTAKGYQIRYYDAEGRFRKRTFKGITRDDACKIERDILAKRDRGEAFVDRRKAPTFREFAEQWKEEGRARWKPSTLVQYKNVLAKQLLPAFGGVRLTGITEESILREVTAWKDKGLSARRINLILCVLKGILKTATRRHLLVSDPATAVRMLPEPRTEVDPLSPEEVKRYLEACPSFWRPYFITAFQTGARPCEMAALKWGDVDLKRKIAHIHAARARGIEGAPKTPSGVRDLDLSAAVVDALRAQRREQSRRHLRTGRRRLPARERYVFTGPHDGHLNVNFVRTEIWYPTLEEAGLRCRKFYQTRHTFASNALSSHEDPSWVMRMMGHKTLEIIFETYARFIPNRSRQDGAGLARAFAAAGVGRNPVLIPKGSYRGVNSNPTAELGKVGAEGGT